ARLAVERLLGAHPAKEDVAEGLHQALALDYPLAVVRVPAPAQVGLEHRGLRLLDLEEQRVVRVPPDEQDDPAPRPDTSDADHLPGDVEPAELLDEMPPVPLEGSPVPPVELVQRVEDPVRGDPDLLGELRDRHDQRWVGDQAPLAVDLARELGERLQAV